MRLRPSRVYGKPWWAFPTGPQWKAWQADPARQHLPPRQTIAEIGTDNAPVHTFVVKAREDLEIARQVRSLLGEA